MRRVVVGVALLLCALVGVAAQQGGLSLQANPTLQIPLGPTLSEEIQYYTIGGGFSLTGEYAFPSAPMFSADAALQFEYMPLNSVGTGLMAFYGGVGAGFRMTLLPRTRGKLVLRGGVSVATGAGETAALPYVEAATDFDFLLTPALTLGLGVGYKQSFWGPNTLYQGIGINLSVGYRLSASGRGATIEYTPSFEPIYPLYYTYYDTHPFGRVVLANDDQEEIRNVRVLLTVPQFMDRPQLCGDYDRILPGDAVEVPVVALFTNAIFEVSEGLKVAGTVSIQYDYLGKTIVEENPVTLTVQNRNAMTWDDDQKAAAFMTVNHPLIRGYAKNLAATIRDDDLNAFSNEFRIAVGIFSMLEQYGMRYIQDGATPYAQLSESPDSIDQILFPTESLNYKAGDCDDLSILYATLLEAAGIETALITIPGHIYVAFNLGMSRSRAALLFPETVDMIDLNETVWIPVEVTLVGDGFTQAWAVGAQEWRAASETGTARIYSVHQAWATYSPVESALQTVLYLPDPAGIVEPYRAEIDRYIDRGLYVAVSEIEQALEGRGENAALRNRLGVTYARYGRLGPAETEFRLALAAEPYCPALINLGNVCFLRREFDAAAEYYRQAIDVDSESSLALLGLVKTSYELEQYGELDRYMVQLVALDPARAEAVSHLGTVGASTDRSSAAVDSAIGGWDE